ncbi:MAG: ABC transporter substrate-binding protein [Alphaproteobacteria bacterium]|nr:ABC transporter substrate-binding protein [Alphaproteobacteria bacterium]
MTHPIRVLLGATAIAAVLAAGAPAALAQSSGKTLKFIPQADLRILDPIFTTAYITRNHGYMVYDTLLAVDAQFNIKPQMADSWTVSADKLTYTFTLRDGLKFHDGQAVRPADVIASIKRWGARDVIGQTLIERTASMEAIDAKSFKIVLKQTFALTLEALAKPSSNTPFIMPERIANTSPNEQIKDATGSGPFKFVANEWVPGNKVVYVKNTDYVPRKEPPSWASGGKVAKVDRVEWLYIPDTATAAAAIDKGEVDWWEQVPVDLVPLLNKNKDIKVENIDPLGSLGIIRFNHTLPPFDNVKMRQALLHVVDQNDYMLAIAGDAKNGKVCASYFTCGTPMASDVDTQIILGKRDMDKAKALIREAGYKGEKIIILSATDQPIVHAQGLLTAELLRKLGLNVELAASDWGTLITRRSSKETLDKGGWSIFHTWWVGPDLASPAQNAALRGNGGAAWFGWPTDPEMEKMRGAWFDAPDIEAQKKIAADMQKRAYQTVPYIPTAQFILPTAFRKNIEGIIVAPVAFLWNIEKK